MAKMQAFSDSVDSNRTLGPKRESKCNIEIHTCRKTILKSSNLLQCYNFFRLLYKHPHRVEIQNYSNCNPWTNTGAQRGIQSLK